MKIKGLMILAVVAALISTSCSQQAVTGAKVKTAEDSLAYAMGVYNYHYYLQFDSMQLDPVLIAKGMMDAKNGETTFDANSANMYIAVYLQKKQSAKVREEYGKNIDDGENFLAENKKREGVTETPSGLQYEVITMGTGEKPGPDARVKVNYTGTLIDGRKFDASADHGGPAEFDFNQVIRGWSEVLQLMPVGSKFKVVIPYELAYGEESRGPLITPFSTLIFEIELLEIVKQ